MAELNLFIRFGTSKRESLGDMTRTQPGPGAYTYRGSFEGAGIGSTMVPRRPMSATFTSPGPGAYNPGSYRKQNMPSWRLGTASRDGTFTSRDRAPGPGAYDLKASLGSRAPTYMLIYITLL